ncbi:hypothetical protein ACJX0J_030405 [Zea mays]
MRPDQKIESHSITNWIIIVVVLLVVKNNNNTTTTTIIIIIKQEFHVLSILEREGRRAAWMITLVIVVFVPQNMVSSLGSDMEHHALDGKPRLKSYIATVDFLYKPPGDGV